MSNIKGILLELSGRESVDWGAIDKTFKFTDQYSPSKNEEIQKLSLYNFWRFCDYVLNSNMAGAIRSVFEPYEKGGKDKNNPDFQYLMQGYNSMRKFLSDLGISGSFKPLELEKAMVKYGLKKAKK